MPRAVSVAAARTFGRPPIGSGGRRLAGIAAVLALLTSGCLRGALLSNRSEPAHVVAASPADSPRSDEPADVDASAAGVELLPVAAEEVAESSADPLVLPLPTDDLGSDGETFPVTRLVRLLPPEEILPDEELPPEEVREFGELEQSPEDLPTPLCCDKTLWRHVVRDHVEFYSPHSLGFLAVGFGAGAVLANTNMDDGIHRHFQASVRNAATDEWFHFLRANKLLGDGYYMLPVFAAAWAAGNLAEDHPTVATVGCWGERSLRAFVVGAPAVVVMQVVTGGSRPGELSSQSHWEPFHDANGVSGHGFMGAIPFLTAARLAEDPWLKAAFYAGSTLAPLSRINDGAHYPSQAFLGWWMAWAATAAVARSDDELDARWTLQPLPHPDTTGLAVEVRY